MRPRIDDDLSRRRSQVDPAVAQGTTHQGPLLLIALVPEAGRSAGYLAVSMANGYALGLDARINTTRRYERTQAWSLALHRWLSAADGIRYTGRHAGKHGNYCLFLDRRGADLAIRRQGALQDLPRLVLFAARRYSLRVAIPWRVT